MGVVTSLQWGAGVVICLDRGADLHMVQLMPLPLTVSCFSKIQTGFTFLVPVYPHSPRKRAVKRFCVYMLGVFLDHTVDSGSSSFKRATMQAQRT